MNSRKGVLLRRLVMGVAAGAILPTASLAAPDDASVKSSKDKTEGATLQEIVVTGTLLRNSKPVGANPITLNTKAIEQTAPLSSNELLASLPAVSNYFNRDPVADLAVAVNQIQVSRPNLRNISPSNASSSATLVLVDGHRIASVGVSQASVDPDVVPIGAIDHVEVVTEGGSSTYGADAVAGVINFITKKRFDGVQVDGHYGFADHYDQYDASLIAGKDWGSGSAYISYTYTKNSNLFGRDRSYVRSAEYSSQPYVPLGRTCTNPNLAVNTVLTAFGATIASTNYAYPGLAPNTVNGCDTARDSTMAPEAERNGLFASFYQELDPATTVNVRTFYSRRTTETSATFGGTVNVSPANPYAASALPPGLTLGTQPYTIFGSPVVNNASVSFSYGPAVGYDTQHTTTLIEEGGVNAEVKRDLGSNWQLRGLVNWSTSNSQFGLPNANTTLENDAGAATTTSTAIDPFNIAQTNPAVIAAILDNEIAGQTRDDLLDLRGIAEGKLLTLPGGDVRLAAGYEYMRDNFEQRYESGIVLGSLGTYPFTHYSRAVNSVFGEMQLPLVGANNAMAWVRSFVISASVRYDHYSDFGGATNPKVGVNFKPVDWLTLRGNWGTSFTAPTPLDQLGSQQNSISSYPFVAFTRPGDTPVGGSYTVALMGSRPNLQPQTADTWSVGFDANAPAIPGLRASLSYYDVDFKNILSTPTPNANIFSNFPGSITSNPTGLTAAQLRAFESGASNGASVIEPLITAGTPIYEIVDFRTGNFGVLDVAGLDFSTSYQHSTGFGSVDLSVNGNYQLKRQQQASTTAPATDLLLTENPKIYLQTMAGANIGALRAQVTWNYTGGYDITPTTSVPVQSRVGSFSTVNLFFEYAVPSNSASVLRDLHLTLNINNLFDQDPPVLLRNNPGENGFANGFTVGRLIMFGASKKF